MPLIWRGMGIIVPIIFLVTGFLYSWISGDPDKRLGNPDMLAWTSMISGILLTLIGLAALGMSSEDEQGNKKRAKHDFFFIPIVAWGGLLIVWCIYLFFFSGKSSAEPSPTGLVDKPAAPAIEVPHTRMVNFYNPTKDSLKYLVNDETGGGLIASGTVGPNSFASVEIEEATYMFIARNMQDKSSFFLPSEEDAEDESKYKLYEDDKGKFFQRILNPATPENDDYDEAWFVLDGKTELLLVDVNSAADSTVTRGDVRKTKWSDKVAHQYKATDIIEPVFGTRPKDGVISVIAPGKMLPFQKEKDEQVYLLVPYHGEKDKTKVITAAVEAACFK